MNHIVFNGVNFFSGEKVICEIEGTDVLDASILIEDNGRLYICQNIKEGSVGSTRLGYRCSWSFCVMGTSLTDGVRSLRHKYNVTRKKDVSISCDIDAYVRYYSTDGHNQLLELFNFELKSFKEYNTYEFSKELGMIKLSVSSKKEKVLDIIKSQFTKKKSVEIKFGRFLRQLITEANEIDELKINKNNEFITINDKYIEDMYNKYVSFQNSDLFQVEFLSGSDILKGYDKSNYTEKEDCVLAKSCMVGKLSYLKLYTENPNQVELAIMKYDNKIVSRAIVWTLSSGKRVVDRIYYSDDWMSSYLTKKLDDMGISNNINKDDLIKLESWSFDEYPYVDTFYRIDTNQGILYHYTNEDQKFCRFLRSTVGQIG